MSCRHNKNNLLYFGKPLLVYSLPPAGDSCQKRSIDKNTCSLTATKAIKMLSFRTVCAGLPGKKNGLQ